MKRLLYQLARYGDISWLSYHFAKFFAAQAAVEMDDPLCLSAALVCESSQQGSVCIDLDQHAEQPWFGSTSIPAENIPRTTTAEAWRQLLLGSKSVGQPGDATLLTLEGSRLYLNRFWFYEDVIASRITAMLEPGAGFDNVEISALVDSLFGTTAGVDRDQKNAIVCAASKPFCVISGGPGSGKTSTVIRLLAVLLAQNPGYRIALAAPTGKAAARMIDSIRERVDQLEIDSAIKAVMPKQAQTIHRLLRYRWHGFEHDEQHPLALDCVVVDEASMIDQKLMFHLLAALPRHARLVLLGDRDQLASVAAGNVLGDITGHGFRLDSDAGPVAGSIALLGSNYRFDQGSDIGELAELVNRGDSVGAIEILKRNDRGLHHYGEASDSIDTGALAWLYRAYQPIFDSDTPEQALGIYEATRVLCATNRGPLGVESLNRIISSALQAANHRVACERYSGLPIMITRNHHQLGLFNGDTGILWQSAAGLRAFFRDTDGGLRDFALNRLPEFAPAWTSTVHKSQGSEFDSVLLILPADPGSEVLSRELLYTAITRARRQFILHGSEAVVTAAIHRLTQRHSGLAQKLGWPA